LSSWIKSFFASYGYLIVTLFSAIVAAYFLPADSLKNTPSILGSFAGVVVAALVPTMILAATILKPTFGGLNEFEKMRSAVGTQISFFSGLFFWTIALAAMIFVGVAVDWNSNELVYQISLYEKNIVVKIVPIKFLNAAIIATVGIIGYRLSGFVAGIKSLFELHASDVKKEITRKIVEEGDTSLSQIVDSDTRTDFGKNIGTIKEKHH
jgi:hypothetical protein